MNKSRIYDFEFRVFQKSLQKKFLETQGSYDFYGDISSKQFLKFISYLFSFILNYYHFFENYPKIKHNLSCISMSNNSWMCSLISSSSYSSLSGLLYFSQMNKLYSLSYPGLKIFLSESSPSSPNPIIRN